MSKYIIFLLLSLSLFGETIKDKVNVLYAKSYAYESVGKYSEAIKVLTPVYRKYPKGYTLNLRFAWLFYLDKKYMNAIAYYKKASLLNLYAMAPKLGLINVYLARYSFEKAEHICYEVLKTDYYNYYGNRYLIQALIAQKKYKEALLVSKKMLVLYPNDIPFLELLAVIYKATKHQSLHKLYEKILILDPNNLFVKNDL